MKRELGRFTLLVLLLATAAVANVYHATMDQELDLEPILGIPWKLVATPPETEIYRGYHFLHPDSGIATLVQNGQTFLYWYKKGKWEKIDFHEGETLAGAFLFTMHSFCAIHNDGRPYKNNPIFYNNGEWILTPAPNPDRMKSLFFESPQRGWAACESSRLLFWNGTDWKDLYTDVSEHYISILPFNKYIFSKIRHGNEFLVHDRNTLKLVEHHNSKEYNTLKTIFRLGNDVDVDPLIDSQDIRMSKQDSVYVSLKVRDKPLLWISKNSGTLSSEMLGIFRTDYELLQKEFMCIVNFDIRSEELYNEYLFYSSNKICKNIAIIREAPPEPIRLFGRNLRFTDEGAFCFADFNMDGRQDIYIIQTGEANKLLITIKDTPTYSNKYIDIAEKAGVQGGAYVQEGRVNYDSDALIADLDEDGDQDIFVVSMYGPNEFFRQYKKLKFMDDTFNSHVLADSGRSKSVLSGDINNDGSLDLLVCNTRKEPNHIYLNNHAGIFRDETRELGLPDSINGEGWLLADFDNDNDLDLFAPQFKLPDRFFINEQKDGRVYFRENTNWRADLDSLFFTCSATTADFDNDGDLDLFCCRSGYENVMYENDGTGHFTDVSFKTNMSDDLNSNQTNAFDVDNDGWLDVYVSNRKNAKIYKNLGNFHFQDLELDYIYYEKSYPGIASAADMDNDGDIDLMIEDAFEKSLICKNQTNNNRFIKLKIHGSKSNRDAVGTHIWFYDAGHLGESPYCRGLRTVSAGNSKTGKNSRIVHLGVYDEQPVDAIVRFPSGIVKHVKNIKAASTIHIYEQEGMARKYALLLKHIRSIIHYQPNQRDFAIFVLYLLTVVLTVLYFSRQFPLSKTALNWVVIMPLILYLFMFFLLFANHTVLRHLVPIFSGSSACVFGFWVSAKIYQSEMEQPELLEKLYFKTSAFFHGEWGATRLNRLQLFCSNADEETVNDPEFRTILNEVINSYFTLITPEIDSIIAIIKNVHDFEEHYHVCRTQHRQLLKQLNVLRIAINLDKDVQAEFAATFQNVSALKAELSKIRAVVSKDFKTDVGAAISTYFVTNSFPKMHIQYKQPEEKFIARIRPSEFSQIFDNLVKNAERAMLACKQPTLQVTCEANLDHVNFIVSDNGPGISAHVREKLFNEQITTRKKSGGFGLYYTAQVLKKYNAIISVQDSQQGASFLIQLRRLQDEQA